MARYARIVSGAVATVQDFGIAPDPNPAKGLDWRPCPSVAKPAFDQTTETVEGFPQRRLNLAFDNRLRALEGQASRTMLQFLVYWKALL